MGPDGYGGECMGCGNQEHFVNCADIAIGTTAVKPLPQLPETASKPVQPSQHVAHPGPEYSVAGSQSNPINYAPSPAVAKTPAYNPPAKVAANSKATTESPWNMDSNMMLQNLMAGAFGQTNLMITTPSPWNNAWPQQQEPQNVPAQMPYFQDPSMSSMFGMLPNFLRESNEWSTDTPTHNQHQHQRAPPAPQVHASGHDPADYAGNEPGEYPEFETPSQGPSPVSGASSGSSSYMQGFNDALKQMQGLGLSGDWSSFNPKASRAVSEITLSLQEKQKQQSSNPNCPGRVCKATGSWKGQSNLDTWCETTCKVGQCPGHMCACRCPGLGVW